MIIKLLVDGGDMKPGPAVGQKLGPLGINIGKVIEEINKATASFKGIKVPIELDVNAKNKTFKVKVRSPPTAELLKKELGIEKASGQAKKIKVANASIEQVISIAKIKQDSMLANDFKSAVKLVLGSCVSLGILVENKNPREIIEEINKGEYSSEIKTRKTQTSLEKKKSLEEFFTNVKAKQDEILKKEEAEKAVEESKKAEKAATPTEAKIAEKPSEEAKKTETKTAEKAEKKK